MRKSRKTCFGSFLLGFAVSLTIGSVMLAKRHRLGKSASPSVPVLSSELFWEETSDSSLISAEHHVMTTSCAQILGRARSQGDEKLNAEIRELLRNGTVGTEEAANQRFDLLWQKIIKDMESKFDRQQLERQLFDGIHQYFPEQYKQKSSEVWDRAQNEEGGFHLKGFANLVRTREPRKIEDVAEQKSLKSWSKDLFEGKDGPQVPEILGVSLPQAPHEPFDSENWKKVQDQVVDAVKRSLVEPHRRQQPNFSIMRKIHDDLVAIAAEVDERLKGFDQELSLEGRGEMITVAIIETWRLMSKAVWEEQMKPIEEFKSEKEKQRKYFCSQVLQSPEADAEMAKSSMDRIWDRCQRDVLSLPAAAAIESEVARHETSSFSRESIEQDRDGLLGREDLNEQQKSQLIEYIEDPQKVLKNMLTQRFNKRLGVNSEKCKELTQDPTDKFAKCVNFLLQPLKQLRDNPELQVEKVGISQLFDAKDFSDDVNETEIVLKQALAKWIIAFLTTEGELPSKWRVCQDGQLQECEDDDWAVKISDLLPCTGAPLPDESEELGFLKKCLLQESNIDRVSNLHHFVVAAVDELERKKEGLEKMVKSEIQDILQEEHRKLQDKLIPCHVQCPCCGRLCANPDPMHTQHYCCGHYPRGVTGRSIGRYVLWSRGNEPTETMASTLMCTEMKDEAMLVEPGRKIVSWADFKKEHPEWDFSESDPDCRDFEAKAQVTWKVVGPYFCKKYGTIFTEYGEQSTLSVQRHFVLILDSSGSMAGESWKSLMKAVGKLPSFCRFSVVLFADSAEVYVKDCEGEEFLSSRLDVLRRFPPVGRTNFAAAFQCAGDLVSDFDFSFQPVVVFMSDGQNNQGEGHLDQALTDFGAAFGDDHWDFYSIAFGPAADKGEIERLAQYFESGGCAQNSEYIESMDETGLIDVGVLVLMKLHVGKTAVSTSQVAPSTCRTKVS